MVGNALETATHTSVLTSSCIAAIIDDAVIVEEEVTVEPLLADPEDVLLEPS